MIDAAIAGMRQWLDDFKAADGDRRRAMTEALAWKVKENGEAFRKGFMKLREEVVAELPLAEDLVYYFVLAFIPPAAREPLIGPLVGFVPRLLESSPVGTEHDKVHEAIVRVLDRVSTSTYDETPVERPHPFAYMTISPEQAAFFARRLEASQSVQHPRYGFGQRLRDKHGFEGEVFAIYGSFDDVLEHLGFSGWWEQQSIPPSTRDQVFYAIRDEVGHEGTVLVGELDAVDPSAPSGGAGDEDDDGDPEPVAGGGGPAVETAT